MQAKEEKKIGQIDRLIENNGVVTKGDDWSKVAGQRLIVYRITYKKDMRSSIFNYYFVLLETFFEVHRSCMI